MCPVRSNTLPFHSLEMSIDIHPSRVNLVAAQSLFVFLIPLLSVLLNRVYSFQTYLWPAR